jgi:hypothetical protein
VKRCKTLTPPDIEITKAVDKKGQGSYNCDSSTAKSRSINITLEATDVLEIDRLEYSLGGRHFPPA